MSISHNVSMGNVGNLMSYVPIVSSNVMIGSSLILVKREARRLHANGLNSQHEFLNDSLSINISKMAGVVGLALSPTSK